MDEKEFQAMKALFKKKDRVLATTELVHSEAYDKAAREHLTDDDGNIDYNKLKKAEVQKSMEDTMKEHYLAASKKGLKAEGGDELQNQMLIDAYMGATTEVIGQQLRGKKHRYTKQEHSGLVAELKGEQDKKLTGVVFGQINETPEHMKAVAEYVGAGLKGKIKHEKLTKQLAQQLLAAHYASGTTDEMLTGQEYYTAGK